MFSRILLGLAMLLASAGNLFGGSQFPPNPITDSNLLTASYLGQGGDERIRASAIMSNGNIVLAGATNRLWTLAAARGSRVYGTTSSGRGGFVAIFNPTGSQLLYGAAFAPGTAEISDLALDNADNIYLAAVGFAGLQALIQGSGTYDTSLEGSDDPAVIKLSPTAQSMAWASFGPSAASPTPAPFIGLLSAGRPALGGKTLAVFAADGRSLAASAVSDSAFKDNAPADMAADPATNRLYLIGSAQVDSTLQTPILEAWSLGGSGLARSWRAYSQPASVIRGQNLGADTRGLALGLDRAGRVLAVLSADGGNTVLSRDPFAIGVPLAGTALNDAYQTSYGAGGGPKSSFVGIYAPGSGAIIDASFLHGARLDNNRYVTNTTTGAAIAADTADRIYVAGSTACCFPAPNAPAPNAPVRFVSAYGGGEAFLAIFAADLSRLEFGSYMGGTSGGESYATLAVRWGTAVLAGETSADGALLRAPVQAARGGGQDGLWAFLGTGEAPEIDAGPDQTVSYKQQIALGAPQPGIARYAWLQTGGQTVALSTPNTATTTLIAPGSLVTQTLVFRLTGANVAGAAASDTVRVVVRPAALIARAIPIAYVSPGAPAGLDGSGSEGTGQLTYAWQQRTGPTVALNDPGSARPTFLAPPAPATLRFGLAVSSGDLSDSAEAVVRVGYAVWLPVIQR